MDYETGIAAVDVDLEFTPDERIEMFGVDRLPEWCLFVTAGLQRSPRIEIRDVETKPDWDDEPSDEAREAV